MTELPGPLPDGVTLRPLRPHHDERGTLTELFRDEWEIALAPVQWNFLSSRAGVLRGVHVHPRHTDYLILVSGRASIGLCDLRPGSPTSGLGALVSMDGEAPAGLVIPNGVAHGFLFHEHSVHVYAVSHSWDPADELGCRWDDPGLGIEWPTAPTLISERDLTLQTLEALRAELGRAESAGIADPTGGVARA